MVITGENYTEERYRCKSWYFGVKIRDLSGNGRTKEAELDYKSEGLPIIQIPTTLILACFEFFVIISN